MRKLKLQVQISVDGYIAATNGGTNWLLWNWSENWTWDDRLKKYFNDLTASVDCILLSRKMAEEGFIGHWAKVAENQDDPQFTFARNITDAHKVVFTKTLEKSEWNNTVLAKGDLADEINQLKKQEGKDIVVYGGASFVSGLIQQGLIDEYYLFINPAILGEGMTIFKGIQQKLRLNLENTASFNCGITVLSFQPVL